MKWSRQQSGFSLVETVVVISVITVLIGLAYAVYNTATARVQDRAVQTNLRNALTSVRVLSVDDATYTTLDATAMGESEPSIVWIDGATESTESGQVSVLAFEPNVGDGLVGAMLAAKSDAGDCYYVSDDIGQARTTYGIRSVDDAGACQADDTSNIDWGGWPPVD